MLTHIFILYFAYNLAGGNISLQGLAPVGDMPHSGMKEQARLEYTGADMQMQNLVDSVYYVLSTYEQKVIMEKFAVSQSLWEAYRDHYSSFYDVLYMNSSMAPLMNLNSKTQLTKDRIRELNFLLYQLGR